MAQLFNDGYPHIDFTQEMKDELKRLYFKQSRASDDLAYTPEFEWIYCQFSVTFKFLPSRGQLLRELIRLRKAGALGTRKEHDKPS